MDKEYVLWQIRERIAILRKRYNVYCQQKDEAGNELTYGTAAVYRSQVKRDLNLCCLIEELVVSGCNTINLSPEALEGLDKIMEPLERHRRLKNAGV